MTSKNESDLEAQRISTEEEEEERLAILSEGTAAPAHQPAVDDDDDDAIIASSVPLHTPGSLRCSPAAARIVGIVFLILLATDVAQRFGWLRRMHHHPAAQTQQQRWVPTADILNSDSIPDLKFLDDVGDYGLQGLALDPHNQNILYEFHTMGVRVLELANDHNGIIQVVGVPRRRIYNATTDFPLIYDKPVAHIGGIDVAYSSRHGSEIWMATHSEGTSGEGALWAVHPETLDVQADRAVRVAYNLDWVAYHPDGILYFGEFFNVKSIQRVSIDTLEPLPDLILTLPDAYADDGLNYIQSAAFDPKGRLVLLGDDYQCTIFILDVQTGVLVASQGLLLGSETDGITFDRNRGSMLVGFNRQHSHEQVMGQEPMISVIQLDLK